MANESIDVELVIRKYGLTQEDVAEHLFPHNKCKNQALYRILRGEAQLDSAQMAELAKMCGVFVADLFHISNPDWSGLDDMSAKAGFEDGCITLSFGQYKAKINYNGVFITLFEDGKVVDTVVSNAVECMTLSELVIFIKNRIKNL